MSLLRPWLQRRVQIKELPRATKLSLRKCGYKIDTDSSQSATYQSGKRKRRRFHICPSFLDLVFIYFVQRNSAYVEVWSFGVDNSVLAALRLVS